MQAVMKKVLAFISCEYFPLRDRCAGIGKGRVCTTDDVKLARYGDQIVEGRERGRRRWSEGVRREWWVEWERKLDKEQQ